MAIDKSRKFITLVRLGYAVRGLTYILLGVLALGTSGKAMEGATGVFDYLREFPLGKPLLWVVALGLLLFSAFSLVTARWRIVPDIHRRDLEPGLHRPHL